MVQDRDIVRPTIEGICIRFIEWCYSSDPYYPKTTPFSICCVAFSIFVTGGDMGRIGLLHIQTIEPSDHTQSQRVTRRPTSAISASCLIYSCAELEHSSFLWPPYVIGQAVIFSSCGFFFFSLFSDVADWMSTIGLLPHSTQCEFRLQV